MVMPATSYDSSNDANAPLPSLRETRRRWRPKAAHRSLNLSAYVENDPVNATDPTGLLLNLVCGPQHASVGGSPWSTIGLVCHWVETPDPPIARDPFRDRNSIDTFIRSARDATDTIAKKDRNGCTVITRSLGSAAQGMQTLSDAANVGSDILYVGGASAEAGAALDVFSVVTDAVSYGFDIVAGNNVRARLKQSAAKLLPGITFVRFARGVLRGSKDEKVITNEVINQLLPSIDRRCSLK